MEHTKLPWVVWENEEGTYIALFSEDDTEGIHVAECCGKHLSFGGAYPLDDTDRANARYAETACNHFEEAVELLKKANREFERIMDVVCDEDRESLFDITEEIEDHLAKIGGSHE